jgi:methylphosphotriester-DNA--protein-cysteine methyltransferase
MINERKIILSKIKERNISVEDAAIALGFSSREGLYRMLMHPGKMKVEQLVSLSNLIRMSPRKIMKIYGIPV